MVVSDKTDYGSFAESSSQHMPAVLGSSNNSINIIANSNNSRLNSNLITPTVNSTIIINNSKTIATSQNINNKSSVIEREIGQNRTSRRSSINRLSSVSSLESSGGGVINRLNGSKNKTENNSQVQVHRQSSNKPVLGLALDIGLKSRVTVLESHQTQEDHLENQGQSQNSNSSANTHQRTQSNYSTSSSPMSTNSGDLLFRTPLLQDSHNGNWSDQNQDEYESTEIKRNGSAVRINMPAASREDEFPLNNGKKFPKEKRKTIVSFVFLFFNFFLATLSLALVHERVPSVDPLPDIILDHLTQKDWALDVSEILIVFSTTFTFIAVLLHKHRWIVFRRIFFIMGVLYMMRSLTMFVTVLPVANKNYFCSPKANSTNFLLIMKRAFRLFSGFGLSINGQHTFCGDYIYSGHTLILVTAYLVIQEYTPKKLLHCASFLISLTGIIMVIIARGHYTIDVVIAYYVTTRVFWIYHTLANNPQCRNNVPFNYLTRAWWYRGFLWLEGNVNHPLPQHYSFPWSKKIFFGSRHERRNI